MLTCERNEGIATITPYCALLEDSKIPFLKRSARRDVNNQRCKESLFQFPLLSIGHFEARFKAEFFEV